MSQFLTDLSQLQIQALVPTIVGLITIAGVVFYKIPLKLWSACKWTWNSVTAFTLRQTMPSKAIAIVANERDSWWSMGKVASTPAMQVVVRCFVTNMTEQPIIILDAHLKSLHSKADFWLSSNGPRARSGGVAPPRSTVEFSGTFWIQPPVLEEGKLLRSTLVLVDQFNNRHIVKNIRVVGHRNESQMAKKESGESLHTISDPVEKKIVSVLKNETARYRECGRRVGGLGSVMTMQNGKPIYGVGTDSRPADSPHENSIVPGGDSHVIMSENAAALINLYKSLQNEEAQFRYITALETRLTKGSEYSAIGYFILLVLFSISKLKVALSGSRKLEGDGEFGFSDFLRLLDGLLRYEHQLFSENDLDEIEKRIDETKEHSFRIKERIAAIRAYRLRQSIGA